jgi:hypothetical protein
MRQSRSTIERRRPAKRAEAQPLTAVLQARPRSAADEVAPLTPALEDSTEALLAELKPGFPR